MILAYERVKVLTSKLCKLPLKIPLLVHDLLISIRAKEDLPILIASDTDGTSPLATSVAPIEDGDLGLVGEENSSNLTQGSLPKRARVRRQVKTL